MKTKLLLSLLALAGIVAFASCSKDDNGNEGGGEGLSEVKITESDNAIKLTYSQSEAPGMSVDVEYLWEFNGDACTRCVQKSTYPTADIAAAVYQELLNESVRGSVGEGSGSPEPTYSLSGRVITCDLTALYSGKTKAQVRQAAQFLKQAIEGSQGGTDTPGGDTPGGDTPGGGDVVGGDPSDVAIMYYISGETIPLNFEDDVYVIGSFKENGVVKTGWYSISYTDENSFTHLDLTSGDFPATEGTQIHFLIFHTEVGKPEVASDGSLELDLSAQLNGPAFILAGSGTYVSGQVFAILYHQCAFVRIGSFSGIGHNEQSVTVKLGGRDLVTSVTMELGDNGYAPVPGEANEVVTIAYDKSLNSDSGFMWAYLPGKYNYDVALSARSLYGDYLYETRFDATDVSDLEQGDVLTLNNLPLTEVGVRMYSGSPFWAYQNIGATSTNPSGDYFTWANVDGHADRDYWVAYSAATYEESEGGPYKSNIMARSKYDAAWMNLGGTWRMPSQDNFYTLAQRCNVAWTADGAVFTGKGDYSACTITLPWSGQDGWPSAYSNSYYWTATYNAATSTQFKHAYAFCIAYDAVGPYETKQTEPQICYCGFAIRPVSE